jgi:hypothetical protein
MAGGAVGATATGDDADVATAVGDGAGVAATTGDAVGGMATVGAVVDGADDGGSGVAVGADDPTPWQATSRLAMRTSGPTRLRSVRPGVRPSAGFI